MTGDMFFGIIVGVVFISCVIGIIVLAVRQKRTTGAWPRELTHTDHDTPMFTWHSLGFGAYFLLRHQVWLNKEGWISSIPGSIALATVSLTLFITQAAIAGLAISYCFSYGWHKGYRLWQSSRLLFAIVLGIFLVWDIRFLSADAWVWAIAVPASALVTPILVRRMYTAMFPQAGQPPDEESRPRVETRR